MKVLLATDGTKQSDAAVKILDRFCLNDGDEVKIITVIDMAVPMTIDIYGGFLPDTTELEKIAKENAAKVLEETAKSVQGCCRSENVAITTEALFGSPESRIVETAEQDGTDLIIIGSHGYKAWERLLLGSTSDSVVRHAPCSVLVVRTDDAESTKDAG
jgi:nucleotide-binding universal stress UspA family protein